MENFLNYMFRKLWKGKLLKRKKIKVHEKMTFLISIEQSVDQWQKWAGLVYQVHLNSAPSASIKHKNWKCTLLKGNYVYSVTKGCLDF